MDIAPLLNGTSARWLVTGAAGFIGSHLVESLLLADQEVVGLDNLSTGRQASIDGIRASLSPTQASRFRFIEADLCENGVAESAVRGVDHILHQAALGSVPRSMAHPLASFAANVEGFVKLLVAAKNAGVRSFVYASSSSVYGDHPSLPKSEETTGNVLSPYAATKAADELFAGVFTRCYGIRTTGLRYFNVFGPRQDPEGAYAAVVPRWITALINGQPVFINGDGHSSRDFCFVDNVVQANIRAALRHSAELGHEVFNIAVGEQTTLNELFELIKSRLARYRPEVIGVCAQHRAPRPGDVRFSLADISRARRKLQYEPTHSIKEGIELTLDWYLRSAV